MKCLKLKAISFAFSLATGLPVCAEAMQWPDTAQTLCYDNTKVIPCPTDENSPFYGQDAQYQGTARSYTKLGQGGVALPDDATEWIMVRDNVTGLTWEKKNNDDGLGDDSNPHDADNQYGWCYYEKNYCLTDYYSSKKNQEQFLAELNDKSFGGYNDWRIPSINELSSIVYAGKRPLVDWKYFLPTNDDSWVGYYRTSTTDVFGNNNWMIHFASGEYSLSPFQNPYGNTTGLRAVRGGK